MDKESTSKNTFRLKIDDTIRDCFMSINTASCLFVRLIPFLVIVDIINGYFLNKGMDSSLGVCVKAVILLLSISILMVSTKYRGILGFTFIYVPFFF